MLDRTTLRGLVAAAALAAGVALAAPASAVTITSTVGPALAPGQFVIEDWDSPIAAGFTFTNGPHAYDRSGLLGLDSGVSAPPPLDTTRYQTVEGGGYATLDVTDGLLRTFSFYLGSPDTYNTITFSGPGGYLLSLSGHDIWGAASGDTGDQSLGLRVNYDFGAQGVNKVQFSSAANSFEFDSLAGSLQGGVPEPATWGLMLMGFGGLGAMLRRRRMAFAAI